MNTFKITFAALAIAAATATSAFAFNGHVPTTTSADSDVYQSSQSTNDASVASPSASRNGAAAVANNVANQQIGR